MFDFRLPQRSAPNSGTSHSQSNHGRGVLPAAPLLLRQDQLRKIGGGSANGGFAPKGGW